LNRQRGTQPRADPSRRITCAPVISYVDRRKKDRPFIRRDTRERCRKWLLRSFWYSHRPILRLNEEAKRLLNCKVACDLIGKKTNARYPCNSHLCLHCHQDKINEFNVGLTKLLLCEESPVSLMTLKIPGATSAMLHKTRSNERGLRKGVRSIKDLFRKFRLALRRTHGVILAGGVFGIHTKWNPHPLPDWIGGIWDVHLHILLIGDQSAENVKTMKAAWKRVSGRRDRHAFDIEEVTHNLARACAYIMPSLKSSMYDGRKKDGDRYERSVVLAIRHERATAELIDMIRPHEGRAKRGTRLMEPFGCLRGRFFPPESPAAQSLSAPPSGSRRL
jgi:hypothetical protein